jgi:hypothetical protein
MSESRVRENRMHGSMRRREATTASRASTRRAAAEASRRPYNDHMRSCLQIGCFFGRRNGAETSATAFSFANMPSAHGAILSFVARVSIDSEESRRAWRRESVVGGACVAQRGRREMAELERTGRSPARMARACRYGRSPLRPGSARPRVHAIVRDADVNSLDAALGGNCARCTAGPHRRTPTAAAMTS